MNDGLGEVGWVRLALRIAEHINQGRADPLRPPNRSHLELAWATLSADRRAVMVRSWGLNGAEPEATKHIAKLMNRTVARTRQLIDRAVVELAQALTYVAESGTDGAQS